MKKISLIYYKRGYHIYKGKILGLIDKKQFFTLYNDTEKFTRKISSCEVKTLEVLAKTKTYCKNHRLVFSTTIENQRHLLISAEIADMDVILKNKDIEVSIRDNQGNYISLEYEI